jgi:hypothetical protein
LSWQQRWQQAAQVGRSQAADRHHRSPAVLVALAPPAAVDGPQDQSFFGHVAYASLTARKPS